MQKNEKLRGRKHHFRLCERKTVRKLFATERGKQNRTGFLTFPVYKGVSAHSNGYNDIPVLTMTERTNS